MFKKGDSAKHYYIVVKGCVNIYLSKDRYLGEAKLDAETMSYDELRRGVIEYCERVHEKYGKIELIRYAQDPFFFDQKTFDFKHHLALSCTDGSSFGELGLMRNAPRAGTAITSCNTFLAALDAESFRKILHFEQHLKIERKMRFFKESLFGEMEYNDQVKIAYYFKKRYLKKNDMIYNQGDKVKAIYIVSKGDVELRANSKIDLLGLSKLEKDTDLRLVLEMNARSMYGLSNTTSVIQKVAEVGEKIVLNDWTDTLKEYHVPNHLYTAVASTEELVLYQCEYGNYLWIRDNYPELAKSLKDKANYKNKDRFKQLIKANSIRTDNMKANKQINEKNIGVKLFTIENQDSQYAKCNEADTKILDNQSIKEGILAIDKAVKTKKIIVSRIKDQIPGSLDDMIRGEYLQYKRKSKAESAFLESQKERKPRYGSFKESLGYNAFIRKFTMISENTHRSKHFISSRGPRSEERSLDSKKSQPLITSVGRIEKHKLSGRQILNRKFSARARMNNPTESFKVTSLSVDNGKKQDDDISVPEIEISNYNCSNRSSRAGGALKNSSNNISTRVPASAIYPHTHRPPLSKTKQSSFRQNVTRNVNSHVTENPGCDPEMSNENSVFLNKNINTRVNDSAEISINQKKPVLLTKRKRSVLQDLNVLVSKKPVNFRMNFLRKRHIVSQNNLLVRRESTEETSFSKKKQEANHIVRGHSLVHQNTSDSWIKSKQLSSFNMISAKDLFSKIS